jgi:hypothetical protein
MAIIGDDDVRLTIHGALDNSIVIRIRGNHRQHRARRDNASRLGDNPQGFLNPILAPMRI